jgi:hypothetical protein
MFLTGKEEKYPVPYFQANTFVQLYFINQVVTFLGTG